MKSFRATKFTKLLNRLPARARFLAGQKYRLWRVNPFHPSLDFKEIKALGCWRVQVGDHYRALGVKDGNDMVWTWIGTHEEYNHLLARR